MQTQTKTLAGAFLLAFAVATGGAASATTAESATGDLGVHSGFHYWNQADVQDIYKGSGTRTWISGLTNAPVGWIGAEARIFKSNGALCRTGGMSYNSTPLLGYYVRVPRGTCGLGYYYGYGKSAVWVGGTTRYGYYYTHPSPNLYIG